jgi:hypothetical protein
MTEGAQTVEARAGIGQQLDLKPVAGKSLDPQTTYPMSSARS